MTALAWGNLSFSITDQERWRLKLCEISGISVKLTIILLFWQCTVSVIIPNIILKFTMQIRYVKFKLNPFRLLSPKISCQGCREVSLHGGFAPLFGRFCSKDECFQHYFFTTFSFIQQTLNFTIIWKAVCRWRANTSSKPNQHFDSRKASREGIGINKTECLRNRQGRVTILLISEPSCSYYNYLMCRYIKPGNQSTGYFSSAKVINFINQWNNLLLKPHSDQV